MIYDTLFILAITFAFMLKGGVLEVFKKEWEFGKLAAYIVVFFAFGVRYSEHLGGDVYNLNFLMAFLGLLAWVMAWSRGLGAYVRMQAGMFDQPKEIGWIDRLLDKLKIFHVEKRGWAGLFLYGASGGAYFALLLKSPVIMPILATMPVWYWVSLKAHRLIGKRETEIPWIAEILFGATIGLSLVIGEMLWT